jgi:hypothetical protein
MRLIEKEFPFQEINVVSEYESSFLKMIPKEVKVALCNFLDNACARKIQCCCGVLDL